MEVDRLQSFLTRRNRKNSSIIGGQGERAMIVISSLPGGNRQGKGATPRGSGRGEKVSRV